MKRYDFVIIGAGIIGLAIAKELKNIYHDSSILVIEKEKDVGYHSSGRNSGVLHAGFYYTANSLKAKFTKDGNALMTKFCIDNNLSINRCQKIVVAQNEDELEGLEELFRRGRANCVEVSLLDESEVKRRFKNIKTYKKALYSPTTSTVNPLEILQTLKKQLEDDGVEFRFGVKFTKAYKVEYDKLINCAGLYADKVAKEFGFAKNYTIIPFKGIYLKYAYHDKPIDTNIYPVPNLNNPFLGVHYTITVDNTIKIGPTAIPAFWRENYKGFDRFNLKEFLDIAKWEMKLFASDAFGFRKLAFSEFRKYYKNYFISLATSMVQNIDKSGFKEWSKPGIRAQLLDTNSLELLQDFVVESDEKTIHILNAVSPAFTSSFAFAKWVVKEYV